MTILPKRATRIKLSDPVVNAITAVAVLMIFAVIVVAPVQIVGKVLAPAPRPVDPSTAAPRVTAKVGDLVPLPPGTNTNSSHADRTADAQAGMLRLSAANASAGETAFYAVCATSERAIFGTRTSPARLIAYYVSNHSRIEAATLAAGFDTAVDCIISADGATLIASMDTTPAKFVKHSVVGLGQAASPLTLNTGEDKGFFGARDSIFAYFALHTTSPAAKCAKLQWSDNTRVAVIAMTTGENLGYGLAIDTVTSDLIMTTATPPTFAVKISTSPTFARTSSLALNNTVNLGCYVTIADGFSFISCHTSPGIVVKVKNSDMSRVGAVATLSANKAVASVADWQFLYVVTATDPASVVQVKMSDLSEVSVLQLQEGNGAGAALPGGNRSAGVAFFSMYKAGQLGLSVKVQLDASGAVVRTTTSNNMTIVREILDEREAALGRIVAAVEQAQRDRCTLLSSWRPATSPCVIAGCGSGDEFSSSVFECTDQFGVDNATCGGACRGMLRSMTKSTVLFATEFSSSNTDLQAFFAQGAFDRQAITERAALVAASASSAQMLGQSAWTGYADARTFASAWYPGSARRRSATKCESYDPRLRSWFHAGARGPADVVFVLDVSGSLALSDAAGAPTRMALLKQTVEALLDTLTFSDFFAIVTFSTAAQVLTPAATLMRATRTNRDTAKLLVRGILEGGGTNFVPGFAKAFDVFNASSVETASSSGCRRSLLFLTDGLAADAAATMSFLHAQNATLAPLQKKMPVISTFTMGPSADSAVPRDISCKYSGVWHGIAGGRSPLEQMQNYFQVLAVGINASASASAAAAAAAARWVEPYDDAFSSAVLTTAARPVYYYASSAAVPAVLAGVVEIDVPVAALLAHVNESELNAELMRRAGVCPQYDDDDGDSICQLQLLRSIAGYECPNTISVATCRSNSSNSSNSSKLVELPNCTDSAISGGVTTMLCDPISPATHLSYFPKNYSEVACCDANTCPFTTTTMPTTTTTAVATTTTTAAATTTTSSNMLRISASSALAGEERFHAVCATASRVVYATYTSPARLVAYRVADNSRIEGVTLAAGIDKAVSCVISADGATLIASMTTDLAKFVKHNVVGLAQAASPLTLNSGELNGMHGARDSTFVFFALMTTPAKCAKLRWSDNSRVAVIDMNSDEGTGYGLDLETATSDLVMSTWLSPGPAYAVKISTNPTFARTASLQLNSGENKCIFVTIVDGFSFISCEGSPGIVVKIQNSDMSRVGALTLSANKPYGSVADWKFLYVVTVTDPANVVQVRLSDLTEVSVLQLQESVGLVGALPGRNRSAGVAFFSMSKVNQLGKSVKVQLDASGAVCDSNCPSTTTTTAAPAATTPAPTSPTSILQGELHELLTKKEQALARLVAQLEALEAQRCGLLSQWTTTSSSCNVASCGGVFPSAATHLFGCQSGYGKDPALCGAACPGLIRSVNRSSVLFAPRTDFSSRNTEVQAFLAQGAAYEQQAQRERTAGAATAWVGYGHWTGASRWFPGSPRRRSLTTTREECEPYDPRLRSWFQAAASGPKNVVLVLDVSGSMTLQDKGGSASRMTLLKNAVVALIDTLTFSDFFAIVKFSTHASVVTNGDGGTPRLVQATQRNRDAAKAAVRLLYASGNTYFRGGFEKAFRLFADSTEGYTSGCKNIILFLTDGVANDPTETHEYLAQQQAAIGGSSLVNDKMPAIMTFSMGADADRQHVQKIACDYGGIWSLIAGGANPLDEMSQYYKFLAHTIDVKTRPRWSEVYEDAFGLGKMTTVSRPIYYDRAGSSGSSSSGPVFVGVVSMDVTVAELNSQLPEWSIDSELFQRSAECPSYKFTHCELQVLRAAAAGSAECPADGGAGVMSAAQCRAANEVDEIAPCSVSGVAGGVNAMLCDALVPSSQVSQNNPKSYGEVACCAAAGCTRHSNSAAAGVGGSLSAGAIVGVVVGILVVALFAKLVHMMWTADDDDDDSDAAGKRAEANARHGALLNVPQRTPDSRAKRPTVAPKMSATPKSSAGYSPREMTAYPTAASVGAAPGHRQPPGLQFGGGGGDFETTPSGHFKNPLGQGARGGGGGAGRSVEYEWI